MTQQIRTGIATLGLIALLLSFGLDWLFLASSATADLAVGGALEVAPLGPSFVGLPVAASQLGAELNALSGHIAAAGVELDIWLVITIAIAGAVLGIAANLPSSPLPRSVPVVVLGLSALFIGGAWWATTGGDAFAGPGLWAAVVGVALALGAQLPGGERLTAQGRGSGKLPVKSGV